MVEWYTFNDLNPLSKIPTTKGRCVRCYEVPSNNPKVLKSLDLILHDKEGDRFHFTINHAMIKDFKAVFKEGLIYSIQNFLVIQNKGYRVAEHKFKGLFLKKTIARVEEDSTFPNKIFSFKTFEEIEAMNIVESVPFDVIAKVVFYSGPKEITTQNGAKRKLIDMILEDTKGKRLDCTIWEEYINECKNEFEKHNQDINIIILQLCRPSMYKGTMKVSNGYNHTKILLNRDFPEMHDFKQRLLPDSDHSTSHGTSSSIIENPSSGVKFLSTIQELCKVTEGGTFWICGTVMHIDISDDGWFYIACKKCHTKLKKVENSFFCKKCSNTNASGTMRYKLKIFVADESGSETFLLWDRECVQVIGMPAAELNDTLKEGDDIEDLPNEIEQALLNKKFMFKFKVDTGEAWKYHSIFKLTDDPTFIATCTDKNNNTQESDSLSMLESSNAIVGEETPDISKSKLKMPSELMDDDSTNRLLVDEFSTTKPSKKRKISVKKEKD